MPEAPHNDAEEVILALTDDPARVIQLLASIDDNLFCEVRQEFVQCALNLAELRTYITAAGTSGDQYKMAAAGAFQIILDDFCDQVTEVSTIFDKIATRCVLPYARAALARWWNVLPLCVQVARKFSLTTNETSAAYFNAIAELGISGALHSLAIGELLTEFMNAALARQVRLWLSAAVLPPQVANFGLKASSTLLDETFFIRQVRSHLLLGCQHGIDLHQASTTMVKPLAPVDNLSKVPFDIRAIIRNTGGEPLEVELVVAAVPAVLGLQAAIVIFDIGVWRSALFAAVEASTITARHRSTEASTVAEDGGTSGSRSGLASDWISPLGPSDDRAGTLLASARSQLHGRANRAVGQLSGSILWTATEVVRAALIVDAISDVLDLAQLDRAHAALDVTLGSVCSTEAPWLSKEHPWRCARSAHTFLRGLYFGADGPLISTFIALIFDAPTIEIRNFLPRVQSSAAVGTTSITVDRGDSFASKAVLPATVTAAWKMVAANGAIVTSSTLEAVGASLSCRGGDPLSATFWDNIRLTLEELPFCSNPVLALALPSRYLERAAEVFTAALTVAAAGEALSRATLALTRAHPGYRHADTAHTVGAKAALAAVDAALRQGGAVVMFATRIITSLKRVAARGVCPNGSSIASPSVSTEVFDRGEDDYHDLASGLRLRQVQLRFNATIAAARVSVMFLPEDVQVDLASAVAPVRVLVRKIVAGTFDVACAGLRLAQSAAAAAIAADEVSGGGGVAARALYAQLEVIEVVRRSLKDDTHALMQRSTILAARLPQPFEMLARDLKCFIVV